MLQASISDEPALLATVEGAVDQLRRGRSPASGEAGS